MRISALEGRVAVWGYGREGAAAIDALLRERPGPRPSLICSAEEAEAARARFGDLIELQTGTPSPELLAGFDWVIKSPGISPYRSPAPEARALGAKFISGTALWFAEVRARTPQVPLVCITGSKGKSTTTAMIAHLLRASGRRVGLGGNIGLPLLELLTQPVPDVYVLELSSYQTVDAVAPDVAVFLNLYPEHLDWHGSEQRYFDDKCALIERAQPQVAVLNALDARLRARFAALSSARWFGAAAGWHLAEHAGAAWIFRGHAPVLAAADLPLPGAHNARNLCAALAAIEALGIDAAALAAHASSFRALPHRLQALGERDGHLYVNDSISTTPHASLAALEHYHGRRIAILVGGHDRGLDWSVFVDGIRSAPPVAIVCMGANGPRIAALLREAQLPGCAVIEASSLEPAVRAAETALDAHRERGVVLLSPGAPSFGEFRDYAERGRRFAELAGFDAGALGQIDGLGVA
jgi:UDP-N-acetylmuramoyl-L-alanine---L-glutamate ligase